MAISTYDGLVAGFASGQSFMFNKASMSNTSAGSFYSLWRTTGLPIQPNIPGTTMTSCACAVTDSTGAFNYGFINTTGFTSYIAQFQICDTVQNFIGIADRILHCGGHVANVSALTTVNSIVLPTDRGLDLSNYTDIEWYMETYTDLGASGTNLTFTYTSPTASGQTTIVAVPATNRAGKLIKLVPNAGHPIVTIQSFQFTVTTGTAGSWGLTAMKHHGYYPTNAANVGAIYDFAQCGLHSIPALSHLMLTMMATTTTSGQVTGFIRTIQG
jgi:hypothetical protein